MQQLGYVREREELGWYHAGLGAAVGLRASPLEPSSRGVYDEHAADLNHGGRLTPEHRAKVARLAVVRATLQQVGDVARTHLAMTFTPVGAGRASYRLLTALSVDGQTLVGLAVATEAARRLWVARQTQRDDEDDDDFSWRVERGPESYADVMQILNVEAEGLKRGNRIPSGHRLQRVLDEAADTCISMVGSYARVRQDVVAAKETARQADLSAYLARQAARMAGS